jgi:hypothetical protein
MILVLAFFMHAYPTFQGLEKEQIVINTLIITSSTNYTTATHTNINEITANLKDSLILERTLLYFNGYQCPRPIYDTTIASHNV